MPHADIADDVIVDLGADRSYSITFTALGNLPALLPSTRTESPRCLIVTDENVANLYGEALVEALRSGGLEPHTITLPTGESTKSLRMLSHIYDSALSWGIERGTPLFALGGGVVGDIGGFAAATLLRGVPLYHLPTTLIAQVDSAIGGKTGINHVAGKNLIGAFYQPRAVITDTSLLQTLPSREWTSGLAEVVKHGLIADGELFSYLEQHWDQTIACDRDVVDHIVPRAAAVKAHIVSQDEKETGVRAVLNFGHTFAHAIEKVSGYGTFTHGEAVAAGMRAALHLSKDLTPDLDAERADALVRGLPVPTELCDLDVSDLMEAMTYDKKVRGGRVRFVLLRRIGEAYVTDDVKSAHVEAAWRRILES